MVAKGYIPAVQLGPVVSRWYGSTLTAAQGVQATALLETAEQAIDRATGRIWLTGAITGERHSSPGPRVWLRTTPVTSIEAVRAYRRNTVTPTTLTVTTEYWLEDATRGQLFILGQRGWESVVVDYTPAATVPATIQEATAALLADWLAASGSSSSNDGAVIARKVGDVEIRYASDTSTTTNVALPERVQQLLAPYVKRPVFA